MAEMLTQHWPGGSYLANNTLYPESAEACLAVPEAIGRQNATVTLNSAIECLIVFSQH